MSKYSEKDFADLREQLVEYMRGRSVKSENVKNAFLNVKREIFVPEDIVEYAYADDALPIGFGQTISQPSTIAVMLELLEIREGMRVLEVGAGSGYVLALLSELVGKKGKVYGVDLIKELVERAKNNLKKQGCKNVELVFGDGSKGWVEKAQFDRVLVSCGCPYIPKPLFDQLVEGGIVVAPVGDRFTQMMHVMRKVKGKPMKSEYPAGYFAFVPLKGEFGWK